MSRTTRGPGVVRLVESFGARGVPAHPIRPAEFSAVAAAHPPAAAVLRLPSGAPESELEALAAIVSQTGAMSWINSVASVARAHDKLKSLALLEAADLPVPPTELVLRDVTDTMDSLPGERFVVKPLRGAAGHGVTVGLAREEATRHARAFADLTGSALVQACLGDGLDRRLFIVDGAVVGAMERRPTTHGRGSVLYGGAARPWVPNDAQRTLGLRAAEVLGLDIAGVDLLDDRGRDVVLEVNACPGFAAIETVTGLDIAGSIAEMVLRRCGLR
jgi:ribosomal protein S6--L-glutamate ligase